MEILSFVLGIAFVVVITAVIVAVYAFVKVNKVKKELEQFEISQSRETENIYRQMHEEISAANRRLIETEQGIYSQMDSRFDKLIQRKQLLKN